MDNRTTAYYGEHAKEAAVLYGTEGDRGVSRYFATAFPAGSTVLDMGCGSGRDMSLLLGRGHEVYGIDASPQMCAEAVHMYPELEGRVKTAGIPLDMQYFDFRFDGILCSALLMHITEDRLAETAATVKKNLKADGKLLLSVPVQKPGIGPDNRLPDGRLFILRPVDTYIKLFEKEGFRRIAAYEEEDSLGREGTRWGVVVMERWEEKSLEGNYHKTGEQA